ncbi:hypothetical protein M434DRAFT_19274 [Hypoxylon sp. CO27-5]|nr:hypothetical protein M434DRAFT_19274 [Hypoxylon sp. CO27-5]
MKIILVTGSNRGLGLGVIEVAASRYPENTYILCSRNFDNGTSALAKLREAGIKAKIDVTQLDVTNYDHIAAAAAHVKLTYGRLDVLVNNAGFVRLNHIDTELSAMRATFNEYMNVHITSVAILTHAFTPLLHNITNVLSPRRMARVPAYGASKVGMNGLTAHLQVGENDHMAASGGDPTKPRIRLLISNPGVLKTAFANYISWGKEPQEGAESIVQLLADDEGKFDHAMQWEFEEGKMRVVPW